MRIPHLDKIRYQNYSLCQYEIGWLFDNKQFIFIINKSTSFIEYGEVDDQGNYINDSDHWHAFPNKSNITDDPVWNNSEYNFFSNGQDLVPLYEDCISTLKELNENS